MMITMSRGASQEQLDRVIEQIGELGLRAYLNVSADCTVIAAIGDYGHGRPALVILRGLPGVESVVPLSQPFKLAGRQLKQVRTVVDVGDVRIGDGELTIIAGPCTVESREQLLQTARAVKASGAHMLRGGAFKPRTSPYDFQGLGVEGLKLLKEASEETGLPVVTELLSTDHIDVLVEYADMLQIGARNMQNFDLLRQVAMSPRPVLLKRGPAATVKEWLLAAEYLLAGGNNNVVLCERGIKTFETGMRNTLDLAAVALVKELSHLPVIVDPSHATGKRSLVPATSRAGVGVGADGLMIEVHPHPEQALCDGPESLDLDEFAQLMDSLQHLGRVPA
jgi:3-deoxy-7-phosphoheptulonate synthase